MPQGLTVVTGGAGFIGSHLVAALCRQGRQVVVVDNLSSGSRQNLSHLKVDVDLIHADIADPLTLAPLLSSRVDTVYHLASQADVPLSVRQPVADFDTNMRGTLNVLEFARQKQSRVVFTSTVAVYTKECVKPISENAPIKASSPYGAAKIGGENYCYAYANCYGVRAVVARLFNVYGPLMAKYVIHDFVRKLQADSKVLTIIGSGNQVRDYTYVDDAVSALMLLAERGQPGEAYNLGAGVPTCIKDLAMMIAGEMGLHDVQRVYTNREATGDIMAWYADVAKLRALGYEPRVSFQEGLRQTVQFILSDQ